MKISRTFFLIIMVFLLGIVCQTRADMGPLVVEMERAIPGLLRLLVTGSILSIALEVCVVMALMGVLRLQTGLVLKRVLQVNIVTFVGSAIAQIFLTYRLEDFLSRFFPEMVVLVLIISFVEICVVAIEAEYYVRLLTRAACRTKDSRELTRKRACWISLAGNTASVGAGLFLILLYT